jgi:signal transduction histidine kinase
MMKKSRMFGLALFALVAAGVVVAGEFGTAAEARAMLDKVIAAVEADEARALDMFTKGEGGFKDRDLYPYCIGPDGRFSAHPTLVGTDAKALKDKAGAPVGEKVLAATSSKPGEVVEVSYVWTRPGETEPAQKVAFVTRIGDQTCAVGYYE